VRRQSILFLLLGAIGLCLLSALMYNLPPVHDRLAWRVDNLQVQVKRFFNPPEQVVFVPQEQVDAIVQGTLTAMVPTLSPTLPAALTATSSPAPVPSATWAPLPASISLHGIRHEYQQFNNCAPASLSMILSYWGWAGTSMQHVPICGPASRPTTKM
jgi:hypothetical protein